jgi:hypothetical protein
MKIKTKTYPMKKLVVFTLLMCCMSIVVLSCKESKEKNTESGSSLAAEKADLAMNDIYQCPMDCEKGKTYDEEGTCPVCKMDLKKVEQEEGDDDHNEDHEHEGKDDD